MSFGIVVIFLAIFTALVWFGFLVRRPYSRASVEDRSRVLAAPPPPFPSQLPPHIVPSSFPELEGISFAEDGEMLLTDEKFEQIIQEKYVGRIDSFFYTTIAGVSHKNDDGTSRTAAIRKCDALDPLVFVHDEANQFSDHAVMVMTEEEYKQLGFLPDRTGAEVLAAINKGLSAVGIFRHRNHHPDTEKVVGGSIMVLYLK